MLGKLDNLSDCRKEIDNIDIELIELLEYRMSISKRVGEIKKRENIAILDSDREEQILKNIKSMVKNDDLKVYITEIYKAIMLKSKDLQKY